MRKNYNVISKHESIFFTRLLIKSLFLYTLILKFKGNMNDAQNRSAVLSEDNKDLAHPPFLIIASTITQTQMNLSDF